MVIRAPRQPPRWASEVIRVETPDNRMLSPDVQALTPPMGYSSYTRTRAARSPAGTVRAAGDGIAAAHPRWISEKV